MESAAPETRMGDLQILVATPTDMVNYRAKKSGTPKTGAGSPSLTGGAPLINSNISVNVGNDPCAACHNGTLREIHRRLLQKKTKGG
jgi:hypothetical protein